jgi:hypothetical protein
MINTKTDRGNLYLRMSNLDLVTKLQPLLERQGYILRTSDSKFYPRNAGMSWDAPWIYVQHDPTLRCDLYHRVFYNLLDHIHSRCRQCWKVVVRPKTVVQLIDLYEFQREMGVPCKCGLERRTTVCGLYGGYFYTRSLEQGRKRYEQVRALVDERLSLDVPVILKRYCTEFELGGQGGIKGKGPSDKTPPATEEEMEYERYVEAHFPPVGGGNPMPDHLIATTIRRWIHYAFEHGDLTYLELTGGEKLTREYVTYHEEDKDGNIT